MDALEQAIDDRCDTDTGGLVHHSDRGTRYLSIPYTERLSGSPGDAYENVLTETVIGLLKDGGDLTTRSVAESGDRGISTLEWVDWFNLRRLLEPIGYVPAAEYEARHYERAPAA